ncbi:MAG: DUF1490 domain-containing protein [Candidatus Ornithomonoglobus sp.]
MKLDCLKDCRVICFAAGAAAALIGKTILKSEKTRELCVSGLAKGMRFKEDAQEALRNMKEDAEDLCYEAKSRLNDEEEAVSDEV